VNIKQGILEETFHKPKAILGQHWQSYVMQLQTKLQMQNEPRTFQWPPPPLMQVSLNQFVNGSQAPRRSVASCTRGIMVSKSMFPKMVTLIAA